LKEKPGIGVEHNKDLIKEYIIKVPHIFAPTPVRNESLGQAWELVPVPPLSLKSYYAEFQGWPCTEQLFIVHGLDSMAIAIRKH